VDANNEHMEVHACTFNDVGFPIDVEGAQSKEHLITHCRFDGAAVAVRASSSFTMIGGAVARATVGVELTRVGDPVRISGTGFEACGRLLVTSGPTTAAQPVTLDSCRFEADQLHADGDCIVMRNTGPLRVMGSRLGGGQQRIPRIALLGFGEQSAEISGNVFGSYGAHQVCPIRAQNPSLARIQWGRNNYQRFALDPQNTDARTTWAAQFYV
jgi:hypothetical protein